MTDVGQVAIISDNFFWLADIERYQCRHCGEISVQHPYYMHEEQLRHTRSCPLYKPYPPIRPRERRDGDD